jgi:hypothetical protein
MHALVPHHWCHTSASYMHHRVTPGGTDACTRGYLDLRGMFLMLLQGGRWRALGPYVMGAIVAHFTSCFGSDLSKNTKHCSQLEERSLKRALRALHPASLDASVVPCFARW